MEREIQYNKYGRMVSSMVFSVHSKANKIQMKQWYLKVKFNGVDLKKGILKLRNYFPIKCRICKINSGNLF